ncbi:MAG: 50S ribosomal protein L9 [Candidatus Hydrogenedentota bacterium]
MKLILCDDVENLGHMGETVTVADGYARNYLVPRKLAVPVQSATAKQVAHEMAIIKRREEKVRAAQQAEAKQLEGVTVEVKMRAGEGGKLFGSVTTAAIAEQLADLGHNVARKAIALQEPIKELGMFTVPVKLGRDVHADVKVWVTSIDPAPEKATSEGKENVETAAGED